MSDNPVDWQAGRMSLQSSLHAQTGGQHSQEPRSSVREKGKIAEASVYGSPGGGLIFLAILRAYSSLVQRHF